MKLFVRKVLEIFHAHPTLAGISGPIQDEASVETAETTDGSVAEPEWCIFSIAGNGSKGYLTNEPDADERVAIVFTCYTTSTGRDRDIASAIADQFSNKSFVFDDGNCDQSRIVSTAFRYAGLNERNIRLYSVTVTVAFEIHRTFTNSTTPAYMPT